MNTKAFRQGFADGFTAPFNLFRDKTVQVDRYQTSVGRAWKDVGDAFDKVMREEGAVIGTQGDEERKRTERAA